MIHLGLSGLEICMQHVPSYSAHVLGPVPLGETEPLEVSITCITRPTLADAEEVVWLHVQSICEDANYPFDPDEWVIVKLWTVNAN